MARRYPQISSPYGLVTAELPRQESGVVLWDEVFGRERLLRVEIGVGNSPFLIEVARRSPEFNYLGFEYSTKRVLKFLKKVDGAGLENIRMLRLNVHFLLETGFPPESVDHFYINHPDPWPKRRHAKKRFVQPENARVLLRLLRPGGGISLRTDVPAYAKQILEVLDGTEGLVNLAGRGCFATEPAEPFATAFEKKFLERGLRIYYFEYRRTARREKVAPT